MVKGAKVECLGTLRRSWCGYWSILGSWAQRFRSWEPRKDRGRNHQRRATL